MGAMPPPTPPLGGASPGGGGMDAASSASPELMVAKMVVKEVNKQSDKLTGLITDLAGFAKSFTEQGKTQTPDNDAEKQASGTEPNPTPLLENVMPTLSGPSLDEKEESKSTNKPRPPTG